MNKEQIIESLKTLASCQGFYSGLYQFVTSKDEKATEYLELLEKKNFKDIVDLCLYFEG